MKPQSNYCKSQKQTLAKQIAEEAELVGLGADIVTSGALAMGLATAPTGAGPSAAGILATASALVSRGASAVALAANVYEGDWVAVGTNVIGIAGGTTAGIAAKNAVGVAMARGRQFRNISASQQRKAALAGESTSGLAGYGYNNWLSCDD